jgi:Cys-tRNA(Pro)/Cys-tRNA(Cys) deacylase
MTPAVNLVKRRRVAHTLHSYEHDPAVASYGLEAADKLGIPPAQVFKTLVADLDKGELVVAVLPVSSTLSMKRLARTLGGKKAAMADREAAQRATGYVLGGVSPLGQKRRLRTVLDNSAMAHATLFVSAGRRGLEIEISPQDLVQLTDAAISRVCDDN